MTETTSDSVLLAIKVTIGYDDQQDRVSFCFETSSGQAVKAWVTCRLLCAAVPHLLARLTGGAPGINRKQLSGSGNDRTDKQSPKGSAPVTVDTATPSFLVNSIDISSREGELRLLMKGEQESFCVALHLTYLEAQRCLKAIRRCFEVADWPSAMWQDDGSREQRPLLQSNAAMTTLH